MSRKKTAIILLVLVGGVVAYNVKFFIDRAKKKEKPKVVETSEELTKPAEADVPRVASAGESAPVLKPRAKNRGARAVVQAAAEPAGTEGASTKPADRLPGIFTLQWANITPFEEKATPVAAASYAGQDDEGMNWGNSFVNQGPVVSAVLIGRRSRRALIDGRILSKGDRLPGSNATVCAIYAEGVEIKIGGTRMYFPVSGGSPTAPGKRSAQPSGRAGTPPSSRDTTTSAQR